MVTNMAMKLRIAHLYPDHMNIYGDRGNILTLRQRCAWRMIDVELLAVQPGAVVDWESIDLAFFGGGQDSGQELIAADFVERQGSRLRAAIDAASVRHADGADSCCRRHCHHRHHAAGCAAADVAGRSKNSRR